jgi:hypothetical protein
MIVYFLWALLTICGLHCRDGCCNNGALHLHGGLLLLLPIHVTEHLVSMCDEIVVLFASVCNRYILDLDVVPTEYRIWYLSKSIRDILFVL